jgi:flagellar L-ring protein FlgH
MKKIISLILLLGVPVISFSQVDSTRQVFSLFTDQKAVNVGDIITIYIMEYSSGSNQAETTIKNKDNRNLAIAGSGALSSVPNIGLLMGGQGQFGGEGGTTQRGNLQAKITARIVERLSDNTLKIQGKREVNVNKDKQVIQLTGLIRPQDVMANNIIYSYNIAEAKISYQGKGAVNRGQRPGCLFRIFNWFF